jgi:hypothetical protein
VPRGIHLSSLHFTSLQFTLLRSVRPTYLGSYLPTAFDALPFGPRVTLTARVSRSTSSRSSALHTGTYLVINMDAGMDRPDALLIPRDPDPSRPVRSRHEAETTKLNRFVIAVTLAAGISSLLSGCTCAVPRHIVSRLRSPLVGR